ncbi:hypothetical protein [Burkholderia stagnalis]|uniref:hypothetical protein n=1 Tax=Burkholderia stagnalis TaxID=1503054 RepID=UPI000A79F7C8|nr:hypothetical protein [Burkholderia stagnalis]
MSVDMHVHRVVQEISALPKFDRNQFIYDKRVWAVGFPAWRALFTSHCLHGHCTGYKLPSFESFFKYCARAYCHENHKGKYDKFFKDDLLAGMRQRISVWYESGMAETHLYAYLVDVFEDKRNDGLVLYDPRADWKLKSDMIVITNGRPISVSAFSGEIENRPEIERARSEVERERKRNTLDSSHWDNIELARMIKFEISMTADDHQEINGLRLFSDNSINALINKIVLEISDDPCAG